jgi:hypothetical protein
MKEELYGASGTDPRSIAGMGVLNSLSGGRGDLVQQYVNEAVPLPKKADPYVAALKFFIEMGKQASQPGATVLGSITGSMGAPVDYLEAKALERQKAEQARSALGLQIAPSLKPPAVGKDSYVDVTVDGVAQVMTSSEISAAKAAGKVVSPYSATSNAAPTKPFDIKITDIPAFKTIYPNVRLPESGVIALRADEVARLAPGSYALIERSTGEGAKTPQLYNVSEENLTRLNAELGLTLTRDSLGNVLLTPAQFALGQSFVGPEVKPVNSGAGSQYERMFANVNDIGTRLADPLTASSVTQAEKNEYSANYQKLIAGGEYTVIENGEEVTKRMPGIDLSETTNLPTPEGLDLEKIIEQRRQSFDQGQNTSAGYGSRMLYNEGILRNVMAEGYVVTLADLAQIRARETLGLGNIGQGPLAQQYHVAAQNWVAAKLREESGAAIGPAEYIGGLVQYFPVVGDDADTIKQKAALRESVIRGMIQSSAGAFEVVYPNGPQYLSYTSEGVLYEDVLNAQGYANELLAKTELGQTLFFKDALMSKTTQALKDMLAQPNAGTLYTEQMLRMIGDELRKPERNP